MPILHVIKNQFHKNNNLQLYAREHDTLKHQPTSLLASLLLQIQLAESSTS
jgi:hypothetical protein